MLKEKLTSRKFLLTVVVAVIMLANAALELGLTPEEVQGVAGMVMVYIVAEGVGDAAGRFKK